ncbi:ankyrin repeat-containing domain protein [Aspergillus varians]
MDNEQEDLASEKPCWHEARTKRADQAENTAVLDWISTSPPNDDHTRTLKHGKLNSEYANSGKWLFCRPEFQSWSKADDGSASVLWLRGPVGTGKSSLVCLIIEHFLRQRKEEEEEEEEEEASRIAYFYCSKKQGTEEANCPKTVLQSLLRQLSWPATGCSIAPIIKERYREWKQDQGNGGRELLTDDCIELLTQLIISHHHTTTIIVDALDECSDFNELLSHLEAIKAACQEKVKFLLSSRMNVPVQQTFPESARVEVGLDSKDDIDFFITTEVQRNRPRLAQCEALDFEEQMIKTLSHRAQGMFRWVELQLDTIFSSKSNIEGRDAFKQKLDKLDEEVGLPVLGNVYDGIYDMNTPDPKDRSVAERALKWVMCCQQPLSIEMLVIAVTRDSNGTVDERVNADYILDICSNFLIVDHNQRVQFAHLSVREYLKDGTKHGYTTADANTQAARSSLLYLLDGSVQDCADACKRDEFLDYAALYWPVHYRLALKGREKENKEKDPLLEDLLNKLLASGELTSGFITCLEVWPDAMRKFNSYRLRDRVRASLNPAKSPVFTACVWGFYEVVQTALAGGFDLDERNSSGDTVLSVAAGFHNIDIVKLLLEAGADVNAVSTKSGYSPIHNDGYRLSLDMVELLIQHGADVNKAIVGSVNNGWTPLLFATCSQLEDVARFLLAKGAEVNHQDGIGSTALHTIAMIGNTKIAQLLLDHGADADMEDAEGSTALQEAATHGSVDMVKLILTHQGLDPNNERWLRQAQFYNAVCEGEETTVRLLLEQGVDMTVRNVRGAYPLHWAAEHGHRGVASILLSVGAQVDAKDKFEETALFLACRRRNEEMVHFLLDNGADINARGWKGKETVLSLVTAWGELQLVELLLKRGADPQSVDLSLLEREIYAFQERFEKA